MHGEGSCDRRPSHRYDPWTETRQVFAGPEVDTDCLRETRTQACGVRRAAWRVSGVLLKNTALRGGLSCAGLTASNGLIGVFLVWPLPETAMSAADYVTASWVLLSYIYLWLPLFLRLPSLSLSAVVWELAVYSRHIFFTGNVFPLEAPGELIRPSLDFQRGGEGVCTR